MNKKGMKYGGVVVSVVMIMLFLALIFVGYQQGWFEKQTGVQEGILTETGDCNTNPTITLSVFDAIQKGTAVTPNSIEGIVTHSDGTVDSVGTVTSGTTTFQFGDVVELLIGEPNYINATYKTSALKCGANVFTAYLYATDDSTIKVFNEDGNVVTDGNDATTLVNQSASATTINMDVKFTAGSKLSSGDLVVVIESANTTEVNDIILSGTTEVALPKFYSVAGAGSVAYAYEVPALKDGDSKTYNLQITPESGVTMGGQRNAFYITAYSKQWYKDTDGAFKYGIENSDGTATYEDDFDYDFNVD